MIENSSRYFSADYFAAREEFRRVANERNAVLSSYALPGHPDLTIDVAFLGDANANQATLVSSGLHGVEGFFGSAVQLAWLDQVSEIRDRVVLIHSVNPYGFANVRRCNENNVDLNRNFCRDGEFAGVSQAYADLDSFLNPKTPPSRWEPFKLKAAFLIARMGMQAIKQAVAAGQYEYPSGLFFGGKGRCASTRIVSEQIRSWIGNAKRSIHLDLHSGLGRSGDCTLLLDAPEEHDWFATHFADCCCESPKAGERTAYSATGAMGGRLLRQLQNIDYRFALAEFGTHPIIRVLASLRSENRAHFYGQPESATTRWAKEEVKECFCPQSDVWRRQVINRSVALIEQAREAVS